MAIYEFQRDDAFRFASHVGIQAKERGSELHFLECPFCRGGDHHDTWTFSINLRTGQYKCLRAGCRNPKGNMITLARDFDFSLGTKVDEYYRPKKKYKQLKQVKPEEIKPKPKAIQYMESRGISEATTLKYGISVRNDNENVIVFPFWDEEKKLQFIKYRNAAYDPNAEKKQIKEWSEANCRPILYGMWMCNPEVEEHQIIITEGQIDALSVAEAGFQNVVSVPTGAQGFTWIPYCYDFLEQFERIVVFGDHEKGKITLVDDLKSWFRDKLLIIKTDDYQDCKDANDLLRKYGTDALRKAIEGAKPLPILRVIDLADVKLVDIYKVEKLRTGLKNLDRLLYGGIPFGGVTIISGKPGEGKSTLASQILIQAIETGHKCFAYSGELPNGIFKAWMNFQVAGPAHVNAYTNPFGDENYAISKTNQELISEWYREKIEIYDHSSLDDTDEQESLVKTCESVIRRHGVEVILIDNLMTALDLEEKAGTDKYERQASFVKKLGRIAQRYNVLILLVAHKRKNNFSQNENDEVAGASEIVNLAMLTIAYERNPDIGQDQRLVKVSKNRLFGKTYTKGWTVSYEPASKRIYEDGKDDPLYELSWANDVFEPLQSDIPFE